MITPGVDLTEGRLPPGDGVLVIDKPQGLTSHDVVAVARRCLREPRIGHTGTLDPLATGVLPLACGRATRLVRFLTASEKVYEATIRFGLTTDSYDVTGIEISRTDQRPSVDQIETALESLRGGYLQMPPAFSAKKVGGQRAYALARKQQPVALLPAPVHVSDAQLMQVTDDIATVTLTCSPGFYVRSFAHSLGELVGTGACLQALRRTRSGEFDLGNAVTLQALQEDTVGASKRMAPLEQLLRDMPSAHVTDEGRARVAHGRELERGHLMADTEVEVAPAGIDPADAIATPGSASSLPATWVRLLGRDGQLLAIAERRPGSVSLHPCVVLI